MSVSRYGPGVYPRSHPGEDARWPLAARKRAQAFGQPGNGQKCSACDEILTTDRLMMEVPANNGKIFSFHGDCYLLWLDERRAPES